jgi:hypothetical protein
MDLARRRLIRRRPRRLLWWIGPVAAAAVITLVCVSQIDRGPRYVPGFKKPRRAEQAPASQPVRHSYQSAAYEKNGMVDEVAREPAPIASPQAFSLLEDAESFVQADIDRNGRVDILDAFRLARYIKSADRPKTKWDINRDGIVNRSDVDSVAFAAVRLHKGVL